MTKGEVVAKVAAAVGAGIAAYAGWRDYGWLGMVAFPVAFLAVGVGAELLKNRCITGKWLPKSSGGK